MFMEEIHQNKKLFIGGTTLFKKMLLLITVVLLSVNDPVLAVDDRWHGGVSANVNDPAN